MTANKPKQLLCKHQVAELCTGTLIAQTSLFSSLLTGNSQFRVPVKGGVKLLLYQLSWQGDFDLM